MKSAFLFLTLLLFMTIDVSYAQSDSSSRANSHVGDTLSSETRVLKAQLQVMREYNDKIYSTTHWALGLVGTFLVVFVGFNWY